MARFAASFFLLLALAFPNGASAFSDVFIFGDSFSDVGNNGPSAIPPALIDLVGVWGYDADRWTNAGGTLWSDSLASQLGVPAAAVPSSLGGNNYAVGGARADELTGPGGQITNYGTSVGNSADPNALYIVFAAGNDLLQGQDAASTITDVIDAVLALDAMGANHVLVGNLPDFSPLAPGSGPLATPPQGLPIPATAAAFTSAFNSGLATALAGITGPNIYELDVAGVLDPLLADPVGNGYAAGLSLCVDDPLCIAGSGQSQYLMFDHVHFMSDPHDLIAASVMAAIPEPSTALQLGLGLLVAGGMGRRRRR